MAELGSILLRNGVTQDINKCISKQPGRSALPLQRSSTLKIKSFWIAVAVHNHSKKFIHCILVLLYIRHAAHYIHAGKRDIGGL